jgi:hypothetical protein
MGKIDVGIGITNVIRFTKDGVKHIPASARQRALCRLWNDFRDEYCAEIEWDGRQEDRAIPPPYWAILFADYVAEHQESLQSLEKHERWLENPVGCPSCGRDEKQSTGHPDDWVCLHCGCKFYVNLKHFPLRPPGDTRP